MKKNGFALILPLIVLAVLAVGADYLRTSRQQSSLDNTSNLNCNEYINSEFGFYLKCPNSISLQIFENDGTNGNSVREAEREISVARPNSDRFYLTLFVYKSDLSASNWWRETGMKKYRNVSVTKSSTSQIAGQNALIMDIVESLDEDEYSIFNIKIVSYQGRIYLFQFSVYDEEQLTIGDQILSTFKFTK